MSGSFITCPNCDGSGYRRDDWEIMCPICGVNDINGPDWGVLELPLSPEHADAVYSTCAPTSECAALVNQVWDREGDTDCPECTILRRCDDCYTEMVSW